MPTNNHMIIAVSLSVLEKSAYAETCDALSQDWIRFLDGLEVTPLLVPNSLNDPAEYCRRIRVSGVLLTSGNDLGPDPGEEWPGSNSVAEERDRTENALIHYAAESGTPVMGVCRGLQHLNAYFGGSLVRDLAAWSGSEHHVAVEHPVEIVDSRFRERLGTGSLTVNSFHNHGVTLETLAPSLKVIAASGEGVVEALYHPELPVLATQWHPERKNPDPELGSALFRQWLQWCSTRAIKAGI